MQTTWKTCRYRVTIYSDQTIWHTYFVAPPARFVVPPIKNNLHTDFARVKRSFEDCSTLEEEHNILTFARTVAPASKWPNLLSNFQAITYLTGPESALLTYLEVVPQRMSFTLKIFIVNMCQDRLNCSCSLGLMIIVLHGYVIHVKREKTHCLLQPLLIEISLCLPVEMQFILKRISRFTSKTITRTFW